MRTTRFTLACVLIGSATMLGCHRGGGSIESVARAEAERSRVICESVADFLRDKSETLRAAGLVYADDVSFTTLPLAPEDVTLASEDGKRLRRMKRIPGYLFLARTHANEYRFVDVKSIETTSDPRHPIKAIALFEVTPLERELTSNYEPPIVPPSGWHVATDEEIRRISGGEPIVEGDERPITPRMRWGTGGTVDRAGLDLPAPQSPQSLPADLPDDVKAFAETMRRDVLDMEPERGKSSEANVPLWYDVDAETWVGKPGPR